MKDIKTAILCILSPRMIGMYPETLKNEVAINLITDYIKGRLTTNKKK